MPRAQASTPHLSPKRSQLAERARDSREKRDAAGERQQKELGGARPRQARGLLWSAQRKRSGRCNGDGYAPRQHLHRHLFLARCRRIFLRVLYCPGPVWGRKCRCRGEPISNLRKRWIPLSESSARKRARPSGRRKHLDRGISLYTPPPLSRARRARSHD